MKLQMTWDRDAVEGDLEFLLDRLYVARTLIPSGYEAFFKEKARYINAHTSTAVEGNTLPEQTALLVMVEGMADSSKPMEVEKANLNEAYELIEQLSEDPSIRLDHGLVRTMNSMILKSLPDIAAQFRGQYRNAPALIVDPRTQEIRYRPPQQVWVPDLMSGLFADLNLWTDQKYDPAIISALAHFGLISVHPFRDGNGRTARLTADMVLYRGGSGADYGMIAASQIFLDERPQYYQILREVQGENFSENIDVTAFVAFHTKALGRAAIGLEQGAVALRRRIDAMNEVTKGVFNHRQTLGLMFIMDLRPLSTTTYARLVRTSHSTAYADLTDMTKRGILVREGQGRNTRHRLNPDIMNIVSNAGGSIPEATTPERAHAMAE